MQFNEEKRKTKFLLVIMVLITIALGIGSILLFLIYDFYYQKWMKVVAITLLTIFYHFAMRLIVGETITLIFRNKSFPENKLGFRFYAFENNLYRKLKVKTWKADALTAKPEQFDLRIISPEELLHNVMQAELVHRLNMLLSFVPLLFIIPFGTPVVFVLTSIFGCLIDFIFVIIQRYNRPRIQRYISLMKKRKK